MSLLDRLFKPSEPEELGPDIAFGRYTDAHKSKEQFEAWDKAIKAFENKDYLEAYKAFLDYLFDTEENNLEKHEEKGTLHFTLFQGSKKVQGEANRLGVKAEAKVAHANELKSSFARRMLELNFSLEYSRYALTPNDEITIVFDTAAADGSPYKLYYALKELATSADKQDDLLLDEFEQLEALDNSHLIELSPEEKSVKYQYICSQIDQVLKLLDRGEPDVKTYPGAFSYLLLELCYRLDYLIKPEGFMMEALERMNRIYFTNSGQNSLQKIYTLRGELEQLRSRSQEEFFKEMYRVKNSFGITSPIDHQKIRDIITGELHNMEWYLENGHREIALAIPSYIVGYCLFTYAVPRPIRDFFHLYYHIIESEYFRALGFPTPYRDAESGQLKKKAIKKRIKVIAARHEDPYPFLSPKTNLLDFSSIVLFARSFLLMIDQFDLSSQKTR
ncbi:MAG: hypothetical protein GYB31_05455 [Bacteroidetes bacterium]|nr:hypothetical protein [Bacteroidota bacterium]